MRPHECYVFDTEAEAIAAEAYITQTGGLPWVGKRGGVSVPANQQTVRWATPEQRVTDGKWFFKRVKPKFLATADPAAVAYFQQNFNYVIEDYDQSWRGL